MRTHRTLSLALAIAATCAAPLAAKTPSDSALVKAAAAAKPVTDSMAPLVTRTLARHCDGRTTVDMKNGACLAFPVPSPVQSPGHPNEPAGFVTLSPTLSGDTVPLTAYGPTGWVQRNVAEITQTIDSAVPFPSKKVLQIGFPAGMIGGGSPGMVWTASTTNRQFWPQHPLSMYQSFWYKVSPNFPANLNANKVIYTNIAGGNRVYINLSASADYRLASRAAVLDPNKGTAYTSPMWPTVEVQGIVRVLGRESEGVSLNLRQNQITANPLLWTQFVRGQWHHIETLYTANTAGNADGTVKLWLDGALLIDYTNRVQWTADGPRQWEWTTWTPVYGGGGEVPKDAVNAYHRLKDFYVSGSSTASAQRIQIKKP